MRSRCARAASSGTTPPYFECRSICELMTLERIVRPSATMAAAVSSQLDSIPRMRAIAFSQLFMVARRRRPRRFARIAPMATLRQTVAELGALGADRRSGAAEIADRAAAPPEAFCRGQRARDPQLPYALSALAEATLAAHPAMAPLLNLANRIQLAAEADGRALLALRRLLAGYRRERQQAAKAIARRFARHLPRRATALTYSYSSTVLAAPAPPRARPARGVGSGGGAGGGGRAVASGARDRLGRPAGVRRARGSGAPGAHAHRGHAGDRRRLERAGGGRRPGRGRRRRGAGPRLREQSRHAPAARAGARPPPAALRPCRPRQMFSR